MDSKYIHDEKEWEKALANFQDVSFLQSWAWGEFQNEIGNKAERVIINEDNVVIAAVQYSIIKTRFFSYLDCQRGPLVSSLQSTSSILQLLKEKANECKLDFLVLEPGFDFNQYSDETKRQGFVHRSNTSQPLHTLVLSLTPDENKLFSSIRKTTRSIIKNASSSVNIKIDKSLSHWNEFADLLSETAQRQKIVQHPASYLKRQFIRFAKNDGAKLYIAEMENKVVAGAIILYYRNRATYFHAASNVEARKTGAAHLLLWKAIADAKQRGSREFDFWGVAPENEPNHPWTGITVFKKGFGGDMVDYPGSLVYVNNKLKYSIFILIGYLRTIPFLKTVRRILLR